MYIGVFVFVFVFVFIFVFVSIHNILNDRSPQVARRALYIGVRKQPVEAAIATETTFFL